MRAKSKILSQKNKLTKIDGIESDKRINRMLNVKNEWIINER